MSNIGRGQARDNDARFANRAPFDHYRSSSARAEVVIHLGIVAGFALSTATLLDAVALMGLNSGLSYTCALCLIEGPFGMPEGSSATSA